VKNSNNLIEVNVSYKENDLSFIFHTFTPQRNVLFFGVTNDFSDLISSLKIDSLQSD